jgi:hypothetical protein
MSDPNNLKIVSLLDLAGAVACQVPDFTRFANGLGLDQIRPDRFSRASEWLDFPAYTVEAGAPSSQAVCPRVDFRASSRGVLSSAGRASPLHGEGRGFDPLSTHQQRSGSSAG